MFGFGTPAFTVDKIPDLTSKVILVTGGNSGLGEESVLQFAKHNPEKIYLAARSQQKAEDAIARIKKVVPNAAIMYLPLDLSSLRSVRDAAETVNTSSSRLDILMNNAGIMAVPAALTTEGYEIQFGTNHVGHALLTKLLLPKLQDTAKQPGSDVRIVNLSSAGHAFAPKGGIIFEQLNTDMGSSNTFTRYGQSKLANILFTKELAKRYPEIKSVAVHPGVVSTGLAQGVVASWWWTKTLVSLSSHLLLTPAQGTLNQLWAATNKEAKSGCYYVPVGKEDAGSKDARDGELAGRLWSWTEGELGKFLEGGK